MNALKYFDAGAPSGVMTISGTMSVENRAFAFISFQSTSITPNRQSSMNHKMEKLQLRVEKPIGMS